MAQKFIGLDLGTQEVKAVLVSAGLRTIQVLDIHEEAVVRGADGDDSLEAAIEVALAVLKRRGWSHYPVGVVLPGGLGSYRVLRFPFADPRRIAQAIGFEVEGQFPMAIEDLEIDHLVVSGTKHPGQALVTAVRRDLVTKVSEALEAAKIDVKVVTTPPLAIGQALELPIPPLADPEAADHRTPISLVIDIGHRSSELIAIGPKGPVAARTLHRGGHHITKAIARAFKIPVQEAEARKIKLGILPHPGASLDADQARLAAVIAKALAPLVHELDHTRLWLRSELECETTVLRIAGGSAHLRGLKEYLSHETGLVVEAAIPRESAKLKKVSDRDWSRASGALGAAIAASRRPLIQLYKDGGARANEGNWLVEHLSSLAIMGLAILAFGALDTVAKVQAYELEEEAYATELADLTQRIFDEEVLNIDDLDRRLREVEVRDVTSLIQRRSALDVITATFKAAAPSGPKPTLEGDSDPESGAADPAVGGPGGPPASPLAGPTPSTEMSSSDERQSAPVDSNAGIVWDDELNFLAVEVRARKIELTASATRLSAQSRLKRRLQMIACISNIQEGKARDSNDRKTFEMSLEHDCLFQPLEEDA